MDLIEKAAKKLEEARKKALELDSSEASTEVPGEKSTASESENPISINSDNTSKHSSSPKKSESEKTDNASSMIESAVEFSSDDTSNSEQATNLEPNENELLTDDPFEFAADEEEFLTITLDTRQLVDKGMVLPDSSRSKIKEEYRRIKRPLLLNAAGKGTLESDCGNLIMVTSSNPNEGKTYTAINLAMSIAAERDKTVLLVDCDVVQPTIANFFELENPKGITDYLNDKATLNEIIVRTDIPTFRMICAGQPHHLSNELMASDKMEELMKELSGRYSDRIVIIDSPPLLSTTEAAIIAAHVGQIVVVVEADETKKEDLELAISRLPHDNEVAIGMILNKSQKQFEGNYYGYGTGYGNDS